MFVGLDLDGLSKAKGNENWFRKRLCNVKDIGDGASRGTLNVIGRGWGHAADLAGGKMRSCGSGQRMKCVSSSWLILPWARAGTFGTPVNGQVKGRHPTATGPEHPQLVALAARGGPSARSRAGSTPRRLAGAVPVRSSGRHTREASGVGGLTK